MDKKIKRVSSHYKNNEKASSTIYTNAFPKLLPLKFVIRTFLFNSILTFWIKQNNDNNVERDKGI